MRLSDYMDEDLVLLNLLSNKKEAIIKELLFPIKKRGVISSEKMFIKAILEREKSGSTAIGKGVAIPHVKTPLIKKTIIVFGRSKRGRKFDSIDGKPVNLFFLILSPDGESMLQLKMLARISRLLQNGLFRRSLMIIPTAREIIEYIQSNEP